MIKFVLGLFFSLGCVLGAGEPDAIYLTWTGDPTTTMTVVWHGIGGDVWFHPEGETKWVSAGAESHPIPGTAVTVHMSHLERLEPNTIYIFKIEGSQKVYRFRTLPSSLSREVRFVVGGDIFYDEAFEAFHRMNLAVCFDDPDFVVLGGDLAYTTGTKRLFKGLEWEMERWQQFLRELQKSLQTKEGRLIPLFPVVGNHDVHKRSGYEIFYDIFPFPEKGCAYRMMEVGDYLSLILLDTGHTWPIEGIQTEWLKEAMKGSENRYLFAAYHIGAYPSVYKFKGEVAESIRKNWAPLFEEAHLCAAFEHHSHAFKRTYPIRGGQKDPAGVVYLGDGSWGAPPRRVKTPEELWYLEKSASVNACWFVHLSPQRAVLEARTAAGAVVDQLVLLPRPQHRCVQEISRRKLVP